MPEPAVQLDAVTAAHITKTAIDTMELANKAFVHTMATMENRFGRSEDFASALAFRTVAESSSGRARGLDTTIAGTKASGGA